MCCKGAQCVVKAYVTHRKASVRGNHQLNVLWADLRGEIIIARHELFIGEPEGSPRVPGDLTGVFIVVRFYSGVLLGIQQGFFSWQ